MTVAMRTAKTAKTAKTAFSTPRTLLPPGGVAARTRELASQ